MSERVYTDWQEFSYPGKVPENEGLYLVTVEGTHNGKPIRYVEKADFAHETVDGKNHWYVDMNGPASYCLSDREVVAFAENTYPVPL